MHRRQLRGLDRIRLSQDAVDWQAMVPQVARRISGVPLVLPGAVIVFAAAAFLATSQLSWVWVGLGAASAIAVSGSP